MKALDMYERDALMCALRTANGAPAREFISDDEPDLMRTIGRLYARGCLRSEIVGNIRYHRITDLGRLALRVSFPVPT